MADSSIANLPAFTKAVLWASRREGKRGQMPRERNGWGSERGQNDIHQRMWTFRKEGEVHRMDSQKGMGLGRQEP